MTNSVLRRKIGFWILSVVLGLLFLFPVLYTVINSLMSPEEILRHYGDGKSVGELHLIPDMITLEGYYDIFLKQPDYLMKFWTSILLSGSILAGQVVVSVLGGYGFAKFNFKGKDALFFLYIVFMMLPTQITLVTNLFSLRTLHLTNNYLSIILPGAFSTFGVFLMRQFAAAIPNEVLEAAKLDGASQPRIFFKIVVPQCRVGIAALIILNFIDSWNMVEQPLIFLSDTTKHPLSIFLTYIREQNLSLVFACAVLAIVPTLLLFLFFEEELVKGVENSVNL